MKLTLEQHIDQVATLLITADQYDEALKYFLSNLAENEQLIKEQINPSPKVIEPVKGVFGETLSKVFMTLGIDEMDSNVEMRLFYHEAKNFLHGMFIKNEFNGIMLYFPSMSKGAMLVFSQETGKSHFFRITAIGKPGSKA